jgi:hypothetical protein
MTDYTVQNSGQVNLSGDRTAMYMKLFSGEVMTAFEINCVFRDKVFRQSISGGKTKQFPIMGRNTAAYHTVGTEITGNQVAVAEKNITIDDMLVSSVFLSDWDEAVQHYEVRSKHAAEIGRALAVKMDKTLAQCGVLAARASSVIDGEDGGTQLTDANYATSGAALAAGAFDVRQIADENSLTGTLSMFVRPAQYYLLAETTSLLNKDWGGRGSFAKAEIPEVAGLEIVKTNNLPSTNINSGPSKYQGNFTNTQALIMSQDAVGVLTLIDVAVNSKYMLERLGTFVLGNMAFGADWLRPICAHELKSA